MRRLLLLVALVGCKSSSVDVCAGHTGACLDLTVTSSTVHSIDELQLTASGAASGTRDSKPPHAVSLPLHVAVRFPAGVGGALHLDGDGLLGGAVVGQGSTDVTLVDGQHTHGTLELSSTTPPDLLPAGDLAGVDLPPPPDLSMSDFAAPPGSDMTVPLDFGPFCHALAGESCVDSSTLQRCNAAGAAFENVTCAHGCGTTPTPHCKLVTPTGIAPSSDFLTAGLQDTTLADGTVLHSDTGLIDTGVRAANSDPTALEVHSGIGFHVVTSGGNSIGVFSFGALTVGNVKAVGTHSVVLLATGDVTINEELNAAADNTANTPGPGGFAGGLGASAISDGAGPGGGGAGMQVSTTFGGAGGGGHGDHGGAGFTNGSATGGAGGLAYEATNPLLIDVLKGGSGGGASHGGSAAGGAGGGAVQIVSQTSITIPANAQAGIWVGGAGGRGSTGGCGGGGAGGAILLEAPTVTVGATNFLAAGGGGGGSGGSTNSAGNPAGDSYPQSGTGKGGMCDGGTIYCGGQGGYSGQTFGKDGVPGSGSTSIACGGGAVGRIRVNSLTGAAALDTSSGTEYVPAMGSGPFSQGVITIQ